MPNSPKVLTNEVDLTFSVAAPVSNIGGVIARTKRGSFNDTSTVYTSWDQFRRERGGLMGNTTDGPLLIKRALERGTALRVCKPGHYTDITNRATLDADFSTPLNSSVITLSGALSGTAAIEVTINGTMVPQAFTSNMTTTWNLLANKIMAHPVVGQLVTNAFGVSNTVFVISPKTAALTVTVNLTNAGGVTVTGVTTKGTFDNTTATAGAITLFTATPKNPGADYNNLLISVKTASNGNAAYFDFEIRHLLEPDITELYRNIIIPGNPSVADSHYLDAVLRGSKLANITYNNLSSTTGQQRPANMSLKYAGGDDGSPLTDADYIGDSSSKTGLYAFTAVDDIYQLATLDNSSLTVAVAGAAYASTRKDLQYFIHLDNTYINEAALIAQRDGTAIDTKYAMFFAGGLKISDPETSQERAISELGDIMGIAGKAANDFGLWYSFSGKKRALLTNTLGIVNNFGTMGNETNLDLLANHGINVVVNKQRRMYLNSCYTGQIASSQFQFGSITRLIIYMKKSLGPFLENYLEDPNDIPTWKLIYQNGRPFMENLRTKRAIFDYSWQGDQYANTLNDLVINNANDVGNGIYKLILFIKAISPLIEIRMDITLTQSGVSFEESIQTIQGS